MKLNCTCNFTRDLNRRTDLAVASTPEAHKRIKTAIDAINLVGKTVRLAGGSKLWGSVVDILSIGTVINVYITDLDNPKVCIRWPEQIGQASPSDLEVFTVSN